jgi:hypothetical protein
MIKIRSTTSFGGEVKPSVPCRRFTACKRTLRGMNRTSNARKQNSAAISHPSLLTACQMALASVRSVGWSLTTSTHMTIETSERRSLFSTLERQGQTTTTTTTMKIKRHKFCWLADYTLLPRSPQSDSYILERGREVSSLELPCRLWRASSFLSVGILGVFPWI